MTCRSILPLLAIAILFSTAGAGQNQVPRGTFPGPARASTPQPPPTTATDPPQQVQVPGGSSPGEPGAAPAADLFNCSAYREPDSQGLADGLLESCLAASRAYFDSVVFGADFRERSFQWQLWSSKIAFWVTMTLVGGGLVFSGAQLFVGLKSPETKFSFLGLEISSPVVGLVILAMSLTFFYLYLVHVYPISEVG